MSSAQLRIMERLAAGIRYRRKNVSSADAASKKINASNQNINMGFRNAVSLTLSNELIVDNPQCRNVSQKDAAGSLKMINLRAIMTAMYHLHVVRILTIIKKLTMWELQNTLNRESILNHILAFVSICLTLCTSESTTARYEGLSNNCG
mmetsp:Transcript_3515/g.6148  ORF Transcript_3515/g.6148 Transcript_3515/m.6148 type:complete len:149 (-) Transcript_3515:57-503(-)